jgi:hypothetical protein
MLRFDGILCICPLSESASREFMFTSNTYASFDFSVSRMTMKEFEEEIASTARQTPAASGMSGEFAFGKTSDDFGRSDQGWRKVPDFLSIFLRTENCQ